MKKLILGLVAASAVAAPIAMSAPASAATTNADGSVTVTKGDIQSAMGWNNAGWDNYLKTHTAADMGKLITAGNGTVSWTVHQTFAWEYPTAEHTTFEKNTTIQWPAADGDVSVQPIINAQSKLTGFKVTAGGEAPIPAGMWYLHGRTGTVTAEWLTNPDDWTPQFSWDPVDTTITPDAVSDVKVNGKPVTIG